MYFKSILFMVLLAVICDNALGVICPPNQQYQLSGPVCEGCGIRCKSIANVAKCYCKSGYSRIDSGDCIPNADCDAASSCPPNQIYQLSGPVCEGCGIRCLSFANIAKCYCSSGYSRIESGDCIPDEDCE